MRKPYDRIKNDDVELMLFSFRYLASTLFGVQNLKIREEKIRAKVEEIKKRQDESVLQSVREYEEMKAERERQ